jgi:DNA repair photolyase
MRWDNLKIEQEGGSRLPGFRDPAVVRTFDAPEALGTRFYEVNARSAINQVPKRSRMPFRYTINPYRGCAHACVYCLDGSTQILRGDGRHVPLEELKPGDCVYGTVREGSYRRYTHTEVLAHWRTEKQAFRVVLTDGTELVASGDHRFLTRRGWKHVSGTGSGQRRRPHLTLNDKLLGLGGFASQPVHDDDYRKGYLCGIVRGDGSLGSYSYPERRGQGGQNVHRFRLALSDFEALIRARGFLAEAGVESYEGDYALAAGGPHQRPMRAIRRSARATVEAVREAIAWPGRTTDAWCAGFLAGTFDAEGSYTRGVLRIQSTDPAIVDWTTWCLRRFAIPHTVEDRNLTNGLRVVRVQGGLTQCMKFFHATDPAISRKRTIEGGALKSNARLSVVAVEPLGVGSLFDITTGTGDFIANGVVSHNCFARPTHTYLDLNAREDFEREIVVKVNVPELVRAELAKPSWKGDHVALGTNTDPYQWVEGRYRLMEGIWEAMRDFSNPCSVLTKSPLLLRDKALMRELVKRTDFVANLSIPTLEEKAWRATEPHTPHPRKRLEAVAELVKAGIPTGILIAPLMPGINDSPEQVEELLELAGEAGARSVGGVALHLRGEVKDIWFDWLRQYRPDLVRRYEGLYGRSAYMQRAESDRLSGMVRDGRRTRDIAGTRGRMRGSRERAGERPAATSPAADREEAAPHQVALF